MYSFFGILAATTLVCGTISGKSAVAAVSRTTSTMATARTGSIPDSRTSARSTTSAVSRTVSGRSATTIGAPGRVSARGAITSNAMRASGGSARTATRIDAARSETMARTANTSAGMTRAATAGNMSRATAVFSDVSKIGSGYAQCRDAYATCMDQFCANANDTYRRCYCSARYSDFRDMEVRLEDANAKLLQFEDSYLNAVDKSAEEVKAMYRATLGEDAVNLDEQSAAAKFLQSISASLSGGSTITTTEKPKTYEFDMDDIFSNPGSFLSEDENVDNILDLVGVKLYGAADEQCAQIVKESCGNDAVFKMATSSYNIIINQDCNAYEKKIDKQKEHIKQVVREAEKMLRDARLAEYRSHNSADVNECVSKVKTAMTADVACGKNYVRCLDYTGAYINATTGEPIYTPRLFEMTKLIDLVGVDDYTYTENDNFSAKDTLLNKNKNFNAFLESKRIFAETALDTCRDKKELVWNEFKRSAIVEIAQAQDEKIEEIKMSCVSTMSDCYDKQSSQLKGFDDTTAQAAGALSARTAREMCEDKVIACASLYGDTEGCSFNNGKLTSKNGGSCGLQALLDFVESVDNTRIAEACGVVVKNYLEKTCTPTSGTDGYPWNCRLRKFGNFNPANAGTGEMDIWNNPTPSSLVQMIVNYAKENCGSKSGDTYTLNDRQMKAEAELALANMYDALYNQIGDKCESTGGVWLDKSDAQDSGYQTVDTFYTTVYNSNRSSANSVYDADNWGVCVVQTERVMCDTENVRTGSKGYATYDTVSHKCVFKTEYYQYQCEQVGGIWESGSCYIDNKD